MSREDLKQMAQRIQDDKKKYAYTIFACNASGCIPSGSEAVFEALKNCVKDRKLEDQVRVVSCGCMGICAQGPIVRVDPDQSIYQKVTVENAHRIIDEHIIGKTPVKDMLLFSHEKEPLINSFEETFFKKQKRVVLRNCGRIDPQSIDDYIAEGGYQALEKVLKRMGPEEVIAEVKHSRLRGRGGAGYPTGLKWEVVYKYVSDKKFVVCNADEGDPGAFMDRSVIEGDPHRVLEGMIIAAYAVGAQKGYVYIRGEYATAIKPLETAIKQAKKNGFLGETIMGTTFKFDIEIRIGAGAFVCGEQTALIASIEGRRGTPRPRPPYPAEKGLWGYPTLINNVETFANISAIIVHGGEWFCETGTTKSTGTKVFSLAGKVKNTGLIEVPMGISLREIVYDIGGGILDDREFKAAQTGGPSGGCISKEYLDRPVDYESLVELGSIMGSGGLIVMDDTSDMVDVARFFMEFCMDESCGKCVPCRVGTKQMFDLLNKIYIGRGTMADLKVLEELAIFVKEASLCGLGMSAPNPLLSSLRFFKEDFLQHIQRNEKVVKPLI